MHIRLAALIIVIATLLLSFGSPPKAQSHYAVLAAACLGNKGDTSNVVAACTTLMDSKEITPVQRNALLRARAWAHYSGKQYDAAISDYSDALALHPHDPNSVLRRAFAHDALGNVQAAKADYTKALQMDPDSTYALYNKAKSDQRQGDFPAAIQGFERVLEIDPTHGDAGTGLLNTHYFLDGDDGVEQFLAQAAQRWPDQDWVYLLRLLFDLQYTGDHESALEATSSLARLKPGTFEEVFLSAWVHLKIGDEKKGMEYVNRHAVWAEQQYWARKNPVDGWSEKAWHWLVLGGSLEWLHRSKTYATFGRTDLAKSEVDAFLQTTGRHGRRFLLCVIRTAGVQVSREADAGSVEEMDDTITRYLEHLKQKSAFNEFGPPENT